LVAPLNGGDASPSARQIVDKELSAVESEVLGVVETMPAAKFDFAPTQGALGSVRPFGGQARHIMFCLHEVATARLGKPMPPHTDQEGPRNLTTKEDVVRYLKDAFAEAHRAIGTLTNANLLERTT